MKQRCPSFLRGVDLAGAVAVGVAVGVAVAAVSAHGAEPPLKDPTRPPSAVKRTARVPSAPAAVLPRLQSVQVGAAGQTSALIDGRVVRVGERVGDLTLVAIDNQGVLLRGARFKLRLVLTPGIAKFVEERPRPAAAPLAAVKKVR